MEITVLCTHLQLYYVEKAEGWMLDKFALIARLLWAKRVNWLQTPIFVESLSKDFTVEDL